jgi:hypothetical protein
MERKGKKKAKVLNRLCYRIPSFIGEMLEKRGKELIKCRKKIKDTLRFQPVEALQTHTLRVLSSASATDMEEN